MSRRLESDAPINQSVERAIRLLGLFSPEEPELTLAQLTQRLGTSRATTHRYTLALRRVGLVRFDAAAGLYSLGPRIVELAATALSGLRIVRIAGPTMERLVTELNETVVLSIWDGEQPVVVRVEDNTDRLVRIVVRVGARLPRSGSAQGRVFLAFGPDADELRIGNAPRSRMRGSQSTHRSSRASARSRRRSSRAVRSPPRWRSWARSPPCPTTRVPRSRAVCATPPKRSRPSSALSPTKGGRPDARLYLGDIPDEPVRAGVRRRGFGTTDVILVLNHCEPGMALRPHSHEFDQIALITKAARSTTSAPRRTGRAGVRHAHPGANQASHRAVRRGDGREHRRLPPARSDYLELLEWMPSRPKPREKARRNRSGPPCTEGPDGRAWAQAQLFVQSSVQIVAMPLRRRSLQHLGRARARLVEEDVLGAVDERGQCRPSTCPGRVGQLEEAVRLDCMEDASR